MTKLTTLTQIHKLQDRYPFDEEEMEILVRCHDQLEEEENNENCGNNNDDARDFLLKLSKASPYTYYFIPGNELHDRIVWIEDHILPMGFTSSFRAAITSDPFVSYANQGQNTSLERLVEGIADVTGRRGNKEVLHILYKIADKAEDESVTVDELIDLCVRLSIACDALTDPNFDKHKWLHMLDTTGLIVSNIMMKSLQLSLLKSGTEQPKKKQSSSGGSSDNSVDNYDDDGYDDGYESDDSSNAGDSSSFGGRGGLRRSIPIKERSFIEFAETTMPMLSSPLSTFIHHLIFHQIPYPTNRFSSSHYTKPVILSQTSLLMSSSPTTGPVDREHEEDDEDDNDTNIEGNNVPSIFCDKTAEKSSLLFLLSMISSKFSGKTMTRLYSTETDGRSFNRLEYAVSGYDGPTMLAIKTMEGAVIGAYTETAWKDSLNYFGTDESFLFQLMPQLKVLRPTGNESNFMYMHSGELHQSPIKPPVDGLPHGLGFGGNLTSKPRLFIPESLEGCLATFMDKTYDIGQILPEDNLNLEKFEINILEIWGVGGDENHEKSEAPDTTSSSTPTIQFALRQRDEYRDRLSSAITRARVLKDKTQFVSDFESGLIPTKNLYAHKEHVRGRSEFRVDETHGGYKVDRE